MYARSAAVKHSSSSTAGVMLLLCALLPPLYESPRFVELRVESLALVEFVLVSGLGTIPVEVIIPVLIRWSNVVVNSAYSFSFVSSTELANVPANFWGVVNAKTLSKATASCCSFRSKFISMVHGRSTSFLSNVKSVKRTFFAVKSAMISKLGCTSEPECKVWACVFGCETAAGTK